MPKVSIILPVYNVEEFLEQSLQSLKNQTLSDIEIICVNDGSTDGSLKILEKFAQSDSRFKIINQQNQGQGIARNNGIKESTGEYIGFLDPDDWVALTMFETLYNTAKQDDCDLVEESYTIHNEPRNYVKIIKHKLNLPQNKTFNWKIRKNYVFSNKLAVWNKLYKANFIKENNIYFMDLPRAEDIIFTVSSRILASKIRYIDAPDYQYRIKKDNNINITEKNKARVKKSIDFILCLKSELLGKNIFNMIQDDFKIWCIKWLYDEYSILERNEKKEFWQELQTKLGKEIYYKFMLKIFLKEFFNNIFSVYNAVRDEKKYKIFKILGFEIITPYTKK